MDRTMRLLSCDEQGTISLTSYLSGEDSIPPYVILSHTWGPDVDEVTYEDMVNGTGRNKLGYEKIRFCAEQAVRDGLQYAWVDTCCIDKANAPELSYAIRSMFSWYRGADRCYVYLSDVSTVPDEDGKDSNQPLWQTDFSTSRWFTRGWTLQELLAPKVVEFFSRERVSLGNKDSLQQQLHRITGIPYAALRGGAFAQFTDNERLSWNEHRHTKLPEDRVYSLFGLFDVQLVPLYGEGADGAFRRFQDEIHQQKKCIQDLRMTDPRDVKKRIEESKGGSLQGSCQWLLESPTYQQWHNDRASQILWITGVPGKGKTMLL